MVKLLVVESSRQFHEAKENFNNIARQVKGLEAIICQLTEIINTRHYDDAELRKQVSLEALIWFSLTDLKCFQIDCFNVSELQTTNSMVTNETAFVCLLLIF